MQTVDKILSTEWADKEIGWGLSKNHQVILKIRPMSYFHDGHSMSLLSLIPLLKKRGILGVIVRPPVVHRVVFTSFFLLEES